MKKSIFFIISLFLPLMAGAQEETAEKFEITPEGFPKDVEREYPGKTDSELFQAVMEWAQYAIANTAESRKTKLDDQYLKYRAFIPQGIAIENNSELLEWDVLVDIGFRINNQKITYEVELIEVTSPQTGPFSLRGSPTEWSFFNMQDEPREVTADAREQINDIANDFVRGVSAYINRGAEEED